MAGFEARRKLLQNTGASHGVIGAGVNAKERQPAMVKIQQIKAYASRTYGSNVELAALMSQALQAELE